MGRIDWMLPSSQYTFLAAGTAPVSGALIPIDVGWSRYEAIRSCAALASAAAPEAAVVAGDPLAEALVLFLLLPHAARTTAHVAAMATKVRAVLLVISCCLWWEGWCRVRARPDKPSWADGPSCAGRWAVSAGRRRPMKPGPPPGRSMQLGRMGRVGRESR